MLRENESKFLSCILQKPDIIFKTTMTPDYFLERMGRKIYTAMQACAAKNVKIDYISLQDMDAEIDSKQLVDLSEQLPSAANWEMYAKKVKRSFQLWQLSRLGKYLADIGQESDPVEYLEEVEKRILQIATDSNSAKIIQIGEALPAVMADLEERCKHPGQIPGIKTGLPYLDYLTGGMQPGKFVIIGGRPSAGKSALALNMAIHAALRESQPTGFISAESSSREMVLRALASEGHIDASKFSDGTMKGSDIAAAMEACQKILNLPLYIYDVPNVRFSEMKSVARQMVITHDIKILFVDYLQILQWDNNKMTRYEQMSNISLGLKQLARELNIPVIVPAQLRRDAQERAPNLADLKETGQIEQDADTIAFIYHPKSEDGEKPSQLLVEKNRDGKTGTIPIIFRREYIRFYEAEKQR